MERNWGKRIFFRSLWEYRYAIYLQFLKDRELILDWMYEPKTFWFEKIRRGATSYKPDFMVSEAPGSHYWVEVKGYMDKRSIVKLKRFNRYFPHEKIIVVDQPWFVQNHCLLDSVAKMNIKNKNTVDS